MAAIQADHVIVTHRLPHRYRRDEQLGRIGPSNRSQSPMHGSDEIGKFTSSNSMVSEPLRLRKRGRQPLTFPPFRPAGRGRRARRCHGVVTSRRAPRHATAFLSFAVGIQGIG